MGLIKTLDDKQITARQAARQKMPLIVKQNVE